MVGHLSVSGHHVFRVKQFLCLLACVLLFAACSHQQQLRTGDANWQPPAAGEAFRLSGKMSFSDGQEGGSGQVEWENSAELVAVTLKAPLSKRSWQLTEHKDHSTLRYDDGSVDYASQTDPLLDAQMGWDVPWEALKMWVRGTHTATGTRQLTADDEILIEDLGWKIVYSRFKTNADGQRHPGRIFARKEPYSIKLVVKQWHW